MSAYEDLRGRGLQAAFLAVFGLVLTAILLLLLFIFYPSLPDVLSWIVLIIDMFLFLAITFLAQDLCICPRCPGRGGA